MHAQVASVLTETDIRMAPYVLARILHAVLAAVITVVLWMFGLGKPVGAFATHVIPVMGAVSSAADGNPWWITMRHGLSMWAWVMIALFAVSLAVAAVKRRSAFGLRTR